MNKLIVFLIQFAGYLWYLSIFVVVLPYTLVFFSEGLDYFVFYQILDIRLDHLLLLIPQEIINLLALVLGSFGLLIIAEASVLLYHEAKAFPFSIIRYESLTPSELTKGSWYSRVRHPMILGYLLILLGVAVIMKSPSMFVWWIPLTGALFLEYALMVEEPQLIRWFGEDYQKYQSSVPPLIPRFSNKH